jgi:hypothetical protein
MCMSLKRLRGLVCALAVSLLARPAGASTVIFRTDAELISLSSRVVHGRVLRQRVERPDGPVGAIYTVSTIAVLEDFTGVPGTEIDVWELGGTFGDETMWVGGAVKYEIGSTVVLCLERGRFGLRSVAMGFSTFGVDAAGRLTRNANDVSIIGAPAVRLPELSLAEFRALAEWVRGVRAIRNREADLQTVQPAITSRFTFLGSGFRWTEADSGTPVNWYLNASAPVPLMAGDGVAELQLALSAWTAPASASIVLEYAGMTNQPVAKGPWSGVGNGSGVVTFEDPNDEISGSTLAIGGGFGTSGGGTVNGMSFFRFTRGYVIWQNAANLSASFRQSQNFARVMEHEIGHTIGLGHSEMGTSNVMHPSCCSADTPIAPALGADDLAGLNFIYPSGSTPPPPPPSCSYSISPTSAAAVAGGGSGSVTVTAGAGCAWTAAVASGGTFLSITSATSGSGTGSVSYTLTANAATTARSGTLTIAGQTFTVSQAAAGCTYTLSAASATAAIAGGPSTVDVITNGSNCAWTAATSDAFVSITSGAAATGSGTVGYSVAPNGAVTFRSGSINIAGQTFSITQAGSGPSMTLDRSSLYFGAETTGTLFLRQTSTQTVRLTQSGAGVVTWIATSNVPWMTVSPSSGTGSATLNLNAQFVNGLPGAGSITGAVSIAFTGAGVPAGPLTVGLNLYAPNSPAAPIGAVDTPTDGLAGVTGSIAVTGWAVDDIEVTAVRIVRDPIAGEGSGLIHIGNAVFVDGSRTDIAGIFTTTPRRTRGGWGYLMLTNFLPALGNGTFRIHAYADDSEGHATLLGSRTITCTNSTAIAPFGAIDTPDQGATIGGAAYANFGWVLSRGPARAHPANGTVTVLVDGVAAGSPGGWVSRSDLSALFPAAAYPGVTNALGVATLDTTSLSNGLHTLAWVVTDSAGQSAGVGSRYFTVQNASGPIDAGAIAASELALAPQDRSDIAARRGYDLSAPFRRVSASTGRATIHGEEMDRFEVALGAIADGTSIDGYLRTADGLAALPAGSHLDAATGVFTWQPGVGFLRDYDLVFVRRRGATLISRQDLHIVINPKGSNRLGPQVVIDVPAADARESSGARPLLIAGWAIDTDADSGTGVDTVHVWAYPGDGGDPLFLGAAAYGGRRPDVGAIYGTRFRDSGYGLLTTALAPGTYDLAVFAWSTVTGDFVPARVVRVTVR